jgi:hypothetical protein
MTGASPGVVGKDQDEVLKMALGVEAQALDAMFAAKMRGKSILRLEAGVPQCKY